MDVGGTCRKIKRTSRVGEEDLHGEGGSREWAWVGVNVVKVDKELEMISRYVEIRKDAESIDLRIICTEGSGDALINEFCLVISLTYYI